MTTPPKQWYLPLENCTDEQLEICNNWRIKQPDCIYLNAKLNNTYSLISKHYNNNSYYSGCELDKHIYLNEYYKDYVKITYDQFYTWFVEPKYDYELIKKVSDGNIAVKFDDKSKLKELNEILKIAFPKDFFTSSGDYNFYQICKNYKSNWFCYGYTSLPSHSISDFIINPKPTKQMTHPTNEQILDTINTFPEAKLALSKLYPELFEDNLSVKIRRDGEVFVDIQNRIILEIRACGKHLNKGFFLDAGKFDWEIIKESDTVSILVPTYKK